MGLDQIDTNKWMVNINSDEDLRVHGLHQIGGSKSIWLLIQRSERGMDNEVVGSSKIWTLTFQFQILPMPVAQFGSKSKSSWYSRSNMAIYEDIYIIYIWQYYAILIYYYVAVLLPQHQDVCEMLAKSKVFVDSSCFISPFSRVDPVPCSVSPVESSQVRFDTTWRTISGNWWVWAWAKGHQLDTPVEADQFFKLPDPPDPRCFENLIPSQLVQGSQLLEFLEGLLEILAIGTHCLSGILFGDSMVDQEPHQGNPCIPKQIKRYQKMVFENGPF